MVSFVDSTCRNAWCPISPARPIYGIQQAVWKESTCASPRINGKNENLRRTLAIEIAAALMTKAVALSDRSGAGNFDIRQSGVSLKQLLAWLAPPPATRAPRWHSRNFPASSSRNPHAEAISADAAVPPSRNSRRKILPILLLGSGSLRNSTIRGTL